VEVYGCGEEVMSRRRRRQAGGRCGGAGDCGGTRGKAAAPGSGRGGSSAQAPAASTWQAQANRCQWKHHVAANNPR